MLSWLYIPLRILIKVLFSLLLRGPQSCFAKHTAKLQELQMGDSLSEKKD